MRFKYLMDIRETACCRRYVIYPVSFSFLTLNTIKLAYVPSAEMEVTSVSRDLGR